MTDRTTNTTVTAADAVAPQEPGTARLTVGLTVIETTVFALDVQLQEVPVELIHFDDNASLMSNSQDLWVMR
ncbi:hypothetical protein ACFVFS_40595 [Kitasatospora sp. NPDC057692]|uniref:hypothetical protein n=1 Tax=Kitasatospora sp. NPDC057692 TaxID=3346215 RepID=UPI003686770B